MRGLARIPTSAIKLLVFVAVTLLLIGVLATLIGNLSFASRRTYSAIFTDATGVNVGDRVRLSGVEVGSIQSLQLVDRGERRYARVRFTVESTVPLYRSARLALRYENIVGQRYLAIEERPGSGATMPEEATFPVQQTRPALNLTVLFDGFQPLFRALNPEQVNQLSYGIIRTLQGQSGTLQQLLANTASLAKTIANKDQVIGNVIDNLTAILTTVDQRDSKLTALIDGFRDLMRGLAQDRSGIDSSLPSLDSLLANTSGLVSEMRGPLRGDVGSLNTLAGRLADTKGTLNHELQTLPHKLTALSRTASYGSWFNFYVCGLQTNMSLLGRSIQLSSPAIAANERDTVCAGGDR